MRSYFSNAEHDSAVVFTKDKGAVALSAVDTPQEWAALDKSELQSYADFMSAHAARPLLAKSIIVDRLQQSGKLVLAKAALDAAPLYTRERWNARSHIFTDDPDAQALLTAIGADPAVIFAPTR